LELHLSAALQWWRYYKQINVFILHPEIKFDDVVKYQRVRKFSIPVKLVLDLIGKRESILFKRKSLTIITAITIFLHSNIVGGEIREGIY